MWANTCWGVLGIAITFGLAMIGLPTEHAWLQPWFLRAAIFSFAASAICFSWPFWKPYIKSEAGEIGANSPNAHLSLVWRQNALQLCVENHGADAVFEAKIDLSETGVPTEARHRYAAVWADDYEAVDKKIFEGDREFIAIYGLGEDRGVYTPIFYCRIDDDQRHRFIEAVNSWGRTFIPPIVAVEPAPHIIGISVSSSPRDEGGREAWTDRG